MLLAGSGASPWPGAGDAELADVRMSSLHVIAFQQGCMKEDDACNHKRKDFRGFIKLGEVITDREEHARTKETRDSGHRHRQRSAISPGRLRSHLHCQSILCEIISTKIVSKEHSHSPLLPSYPL